MKEQNKKSSNIPSNFERVQQLPQEQRLVIFFVLVFLLGGIVVAIWLLDTNARLKDVNFKSASGEFNFRPKVAEPLLDTINKIGGDFQKIEEKKKIFDEQAQKIDDLVNNASTSPSSTPELEKLEKDIESALSPKEKTNVTTSTNSQ